MTTVEDITTKLRYLPASMLGEVEDFVELLLKKRLIDTDEWPEGYFATVLGSIPDFPDLDNDNDGIKPELDEHDAELRFDVSEPPRSADGVA